jgi:hypothetical protein
MDDKTQPSKIYKEQMVGRKMQMITYQMMLKLVIINIEGTILCYKCILCSKNSIM